MEQIELEYNDYGQQRQYFNQIFNQLTTGLPEGTIYKIRIEPKSKT